MKKNKFSVLGMLVILLAFGLVFTGCATNDNGENDKKEPVPTLTVSNAYASNGDYSPNSIMISLSGIEGWELNDLCRDIFNIFVDIGNRRGDWGGFQRNSARNAFSLHYGAPNQGTYTVTGEKASFDDDFFNASNIESLLHGKTRQEIWEMIELKGNFPVTAVSPEE